MSKRPVDPTDPRLGTPPEKFGAFVLPPVKQKGDERTAVIIMLFPPVELRDQDLDTCRAVVYNNRISLIEAIAQEIFKSYTSDPLDNTAAQNLATALQGHIDASRRGGR